MQPGLHSAKIYACQPYRWREPTTWLQYRNQRKHTSGAITMCLKICMHGDKRTCLCLASGPVCTDDLRRMTTTTTTRTSTTTITIGNASSGGNNQGHRAHTWKAPYSGAQRGEICMILLACVTQMVLKMCLSVIPQSAMHSMHAKKK